MVGTALSVVVGFAFEYGVGAVNLFRCKWPNHLMRKCHGPQAY